MTRTWRVDVKGHIPHAPCIVAFWHGEMLPIWFAMRKMRPVALVSASNDGRYLSQLLVDWGYDVVRGSSSKGGGEALDAMVEHARRGRIVMITPDGPRGPRHEFKPGAIVAAQRAQVPVVLMRAYAQRAKVFERSWDKFMLPQPMSHITVHASSGISIHADADREQVSVVIENVQKRLNELGSVVL